MGDDILPKIICGLLLIFGLSSCTTKVYEQFSYKPIIFNDSNLKMIVELNEAPQSPSQLYDFSIVIKPLNNFSENSCKINLENIYLLDSNNIKTSMPNKVLIYNKKAGLLAYTNRNMSIKFTNYQVFFTQKFAKECGIDTDTADYKFNLETDYTKKNYGIWDVLINAT